LDPRVADLEDVADVELRLERVEACDRQVLAEGPERQSAELGERLAADARAPEVVVLRAVDVDRLLRSAVEAAVGLRVAVDAERAHPDAARDRRLQGAAADRPPADLEGRDRGDVDGSEGRHAQ